MTEPTGAPSKRAAKATARRRTRKQAPTKSAMKAVLAKAEPAETVLKVFTGDIGHAKLAKLPVPVQALLVEALLEKGRKEWFDANNTFTGSSLSEVVVEMLGCHNVRARSVLTEMRKRGAYHSTGKGRATRITFVGTEQARAILANVDGQKAEAQPVASEKVEPAEPVASVPPVGKAVASQPTAAPWRKLGQPVPVPPGSAVVISYHPSELPGAEAMVARLLADHVITTTNGDRVLIASVIDELAIRFGFRIA